MSDEIQLKVEEPLKILDNPESQGLVCPNCKMEYRPGFTTCSDCRISLVSQLPVLETVPEELEPSPISGLKCLQHPEVDAIAKCSACSSGICSTCDFQISKLHFCPRCIENAPDEKISPRRKNLAVGAIAIATYCTLAGIITFSGFLYQALGTVDTHLWSLMIMYGLYVPSLIGTALAFCAFERQLKNSQLVWTALIWNSTVTGLFLIIEIASRFMY